MLLKSKLRAHGWLIVVNALIAMAISSRYFAFLPEFPTDALGLSFIITGTFSHMAMLAGLFGLLLLPLLLLPDSVRRIAQSGAAAFGLVLLFVDTIVFAQYRFHINAVVLDLLLSGDVVSFPLITWIMVLGSVALLWLLQWWLIRWLDHLAPVVKRRPGRKFVLAAVLAFLASSAIHVWAAAHVYQPVTIVKRYLPVYYPVTSNSTMRKYGWINEAELERQKALTMNRKSDIRYPLHSIDRAAVEQPVNIVFVVVDSWRFDTFNAELTPNMWRYAQAGVQLNNHYSTGNSTRTGIFGLFYGIPGTYWHGILANQQSPVLIDRLQELDYQLGIFAAAQLRKPEFSQTVFARVENLRMNSEGNSPAAKDADLTADWLSWYAQKDDSKPFFSFLFYDAPHGYDFPADYPQRFEPMLDVVDYLKLDNNTDPTPFFNRYKTSVHYVDSLVGQVLDAMAAKGELDNTLVIITGDHGQEMNDNRLNFWGHNSNFTDAQVKVPFALFGPGIQAAEFPRSPQAFSSHVDVAPTLLQQYLGIRNPIRDYSVGENLLTAQPERDWLLSTSYNEFAIISEQSILHVDASGQYQYLDKTNRVQKDARPDAARMQGALEQMSRFNK